MSAATRTPTDDRGFTLVEVVIAIVLVGILSAVVVVGVGQLTNRGTTAACTTSADAARAAATTHLGTTGSYPNTFTAMTSATPPALTLPDGTTIDATGTTATVGSWSMVLVPGTGGQAPRFVCSTDAPTGFTLGPTGNYYRYISTGATWSAAGTATATYTHNGRTGHLATITSAAENAFVESLIGNDHAWLAGTDSAVEGVWRWTAGPETGQQFSNGATATNGLYTNWHPSQPDNAFSGTEHCLHLWGVGSPFSATTPDRWNDAACTWALGYIVEIAG